MLGEQEDRLQDLIRTKSSTEGRVTGSQACDGLSHSADLVVVAYMSINLPLANGTLMFIDVPENRQDLREKFHQDSIESL